MDLKKIQLDISYIKYARYIFRNPKKINTVVYSELSVKLSLNAIYWYFKELHMSLTLKVLKLSSVSYGGSPCRLNLNQSIAD